MSTVTGSVWTRSNDGWVTRPITQGDLHRRRVMTAWAHGEHIVDSVTHQSRPMHYGDVVRECAEHGITEPECAKELA